MDRGRHIGGFKYRNRRKRKPNRRNSVLAALLTTLANAVFQDLKKENSTLKSIYHKIIPTKAIEEKKQNKVIEVDYKVLENEVEKSEEEGNK